MPASGRRRHRCCMTTPTTLHSRPISRARRALVAGAVLGSAVAGVAANVAAAPEAAAATTYIRFENIIDRWAMNTGFDQGTTAEGAPVQTWSWSHRDPHDWNSQWSWKHMGSGYYQYKNRWSGKCLDVASLSFSASMIQSTCSTSDKGQQWLDVGAGKHKGRQTYTRHNRGVTEKTGRDDDRGSRPHRDRRQGEGSGSQRLQQPAALVLLLRDRLTPATTIRPGSARSSARTNVRGLLRAELFASARGSTTTDH